MSFSLHNLDNNSLLDQDFVGAGPNYQHARFDFVDRHEVRNFESSTAYMNARVAARDAQHREGVVGLGRLASRRRTPAPPIADDIDSGISATLDRLQPQYNHPIVRAIPITAEEVERIRLEELRNFERRVAERRARHGENSMGAIVSRARRLGTGATAGHVVANGHASRQQADRVQRDIAAADEGEAGHQGSSTLEDPHADDLFVFDELLVYPDDSTQQIATPDTIDLTASPPLAGATPRPSARSANFAPAARARAPIKRDRSASEDSQDKRNDKKARLSDKHPGTEDAMCGKEEETKAAEAIEAAKLEAKRASEKPTRLCDVICSICLDRPTDMTVTHCGHLFCGSCLFEALNMEGGRKVCPICRQKVIWGNGKHGAYPMLLMLKPKPTQ